MVLSKDIGKKILKVRNYKNISQKELALRANLSQAFISQLEQGNRNPTLKTLEKIAGGLNVSLHKFLLFLIDEKIDIQNYDINLDPLTDVPGDPESVVVLMKWLQHLIDKCGRENLSNILDYYVDIGWISEDAKISLIDYSHGITEETKRSETTKKVNDLPSKDHIQSLIFIQKLKGNDFDKHFIDRIDSELSRITKKLNNYDLK